MVNWTDSAEIAREAEGFTKLIFVLFGLYVWELFQTCDFEWSLLTRRRDFRWPLVFFFLCRYCLLFALIGLIISLSVTTPINCEALYTFNSWTGNMAILSASTSLMIRTIALWNRNKTVIGVLGFFCLCHWAILYRGMFIVHAAYSPDAEACAVISSDHVFLNVSFFTTMAFDCLILCFTIAALLRQEARTDLWKLLFQDGLIYFCITFLSNAIPAILNVINLNTMMNVIATIPAATVASIAACRLVMRLQDFKHKGDAYVHSSQQMSSATARGQLHFNRSTLRAPEIMVTTDRIIMDDFSPSTLGSKGKSRRSSRTTDLECGAYTNSDTEFDDLEKDFSPGRID